MQTDRQAAGRPGVACDEEQGYGQGYCGPRSAQEDLQRVHCRTSLIYYRVILDPQI